VIETLTHIFRKDSEPFQSLSVLPEQAALEIMKALYVEESIFWKRFKDPGQYLEERRRTEAWLREAFISKGGEPKEAFPIYTILGWSKWADDVVDPTTLATTRIIEIPLRILKACEVSFTYPDSMISHWLGMDKPEPLYLPEFHGKVFTLSEIQTIVERKGMPEEGWETNMPRELAHYIEAQVWNREVLIQYWQGLPGNSLQTAPAF
jgi:hypothetical protein